MNKHPFNDEEIPYHILDGFGLTREMIEDLPESIANTIREGGITPVLPIKVTAENGDTILSASRLSLYRSDSGEVKVLFYPRLEQADLSKFTDAQQASLKGGKSVLADMTLRDGTSTTGFYQIDPDTNQVVAVPAPVLNNNIQLFADEYHLTQTEMKCLKNGNPLTINNSGRPVTVGISLKSKAGLHIVDGDEQKWRELNEKEYSRYNFGLNGCWAEDETGMLGYIPEDEYTDELWDEMKKRGNLARNASTFKM